MRATRYTNIFTHIIISCLKAIIKANRLFQFSNNRLNRNHLYNTAKSKSNQAHSFGNLLLSPWHLACSQTLYFLFKVRRARMIKNKPRGIYWPPAQRGRGGGRRNFIFLSLARVLASPTRTPMFSKRTKRKIKKRLCTGYLTFNLLFISYFIFASLKEILLAVFNIEEKTDKG